MQSQNIHHIRPADAEAQNTKPNKPLKGCTLASEGFRVGVGVGGSSRLAVLYQYASSTIPALCSSVGTCRQIGSTKKRFQRLLRSDFPSRQLLPLKGTSLPGETYIFRSMWCSTSHPSRQQTGGVSSDDVLKLSKFGESSAPISCLSASEKPASSFEAPQDLLHTSTVTYTSKT